MQLSRRTLLRAAGSGVATLLLAPAALRAEDKPAGYTLPKLPYDYDALEPTIDAQTMRIHHDLHHKAYIDNANKLLAGDAKLMAMPVDDLLANIKAVPDKIRQGVINNAGGHSNHTIFWEIMGPKPGKMSEALEKHVTKTFEGLDGLKKQINAAGTTQFGSGWAWLVVNGKGELEVVKRANQDSPIMDGLKPILGVDVWEHAYYLKYQNRRPAYLEAWWKVVNWDAVSERYAKAMKA